MLNRLLALLTCVLLAPLALAANPHILMATSMGDVEIELFPDQSPKTVANFLGYVADGHYTDTIFHRVIGGFVVQGGGYSADMVEKPTHDPIPNESSNGLRNVAGTIAMARHPMPHSARAQFYFNLSDNASLDFRDAAFGWGYTVFGRVIRGMDVVRNIASQPTGLGPLPGMRDVPLTPIVIKSVKTLDPVAYAAVPADAPNPFPPAPAATNLPSPSPADAAPKPADEPVKP